jgi:dihydroflavonol-4-reductase
VEFRGGGLNLVTGGTGFVGAHVVRALLAKGARVRCLVRPASRRTNLDGLLVEIAPGDLTDRASLERALRGVSTLYHVAADYRLWTKDPDELYRANAGGTGNVLAAAAAAGVSRVVYTSSVGALGLTKDGSPADERTPVARDEVVGHYKKSKFDAERIAESWAAKGLSVVIVNPSTPVGELDVKPTPTGKLVVDFLNRKLPAYVDTGLNLVDVRDVAQGHLLAAEKGLAGERYILGNRNMTLKEILEMLGRLTGLPAPRLRIPHAVPLAFAAVDTFLSPLLGREPSVSLESVRMSRHRMFFSASRAVRELGLPQHPVEDALARACVWFKENGYVRG